MKKKAEKGHAEAPIYLRYKQVQEERGNYQQALKTLYEEKQEKGFRPSINKLSKQMVERREKGSVVSRLVEKGKEIEERKRRIALEKEKREKMMREWRANDSFLRQKSDFFERQKDFMKKKENELKELKQERGVCLKEILA